MTDAQFATLLSAVIAAGGSIGLAIRWGVTRITKAMDDQSSSNLRLADAQIELAQAHSAQRADIDHITRWIYTHTPGSALQPSEHERTPTQGMPQLAPAAMRAFSQSDDHDVPQERPGSRRRSEAGPARRTPKPIGGYPVRDYRRSESNHDDDNER